MALPGRSRGGYGGARGGPATSRSGRPQHGEQRQQLVGGVAAPLAEQQAERAEQRRRP